MQRTLLLYDSAFGSQVIFLGRSGKTLLWHPSSDQVIGAVVLELGPVVLECPIAAADTCAREVEASLFFSDLTGSCRVAGGASAGSPDAPRRES